MMERFARFECFEAAAKQLEDLDLGFLGMNVGINMLTPSDTKTYPKEMHPGKKVSFSAPHDQIVKAVQPGHKQRVTLDNWKLYLDSCVTYHSAFVE